MFYLSLLKTTLLLKKVSYGNRYQWMQLMQYRSQVKTINIAENAKIISIISQKYDYMLKTKHIFIFNMALKIKDRDMNDKIKNNQGHICYIRIAY